MEEYKRLEIPIEGDDGIINLIATYDGTLDGVITINSSFTYDNQNEGIDKEIQIQLRDVNKTKQIPITIVQEGKREIITTLDQKAFSLKDGGTFNVLK